MDGRVQYAPMKTVLCVPGHDEKKVLNCRKYGADLILFDLEDSVPEDKKDRAREIVAANATVADAVRINNLRTKWGAADMRAFETVTFYSQPKVLSTWVPKLQSWNDLSICKARHVTIIVETPRLLRELVRVSERTPLGLFVLDGLAFGAADFAAYMNVPSSSPQIACARQQVALAAAALGVEAYDSPCVAIWPELTVHESEIARDLGYGWKGVIHPKQVDWVKSIGTGLWSSDKDESLVEWYERQDKAVAITSQGYVVAPPMIRAARRRLEEARQSDKKE